jgi:hypothetical protein
MNPTPTGLKLFRIAFLVIAVLKIFLVADQEIFGQPHDDTGYARSIIEHYYRSNPDANWLFIRPLGFPLIGAVFMETGIPYRVCIELFFLGACYFVGAGLLRAFNSVLPALGSLLLLAFHPWVLGAFNQFITEPLFLSLMLFFIGIVLRLFLREEWNWRTGWLWFLGFLMAYMMLTRRESPWAFLLLLGLFAGRWLFLWTRGTRAWRTVLAQMALILIPLFTYQGTLWGVSALNYAKWGIFATNEQEAPGFSGLLNALYRIETPDPSIWAPVTTRTLEMVMEVSPRMALLREGLFDQHNSHLYLGELTTGRKGELGAWMWWRLYASLAASGVYTSPKAADIWMQEATAEIEAAFEAGTLPEKGFSTPFPIDPNFGNWLPAFPGLFWETLKRLHYQKHEDAFVLKEADIPAIFHPLFDEAANRRTHVVAANGVEVIGTAFASTGRLDFIAVENLAGDIVAATAPDGEVDWLRRDIERLTGREGIFDIAFYLHFIPRQPGPLTLSLWKDGQRLHAVPLDEQAYPLYRNVPAEGSRPAVTLGIESYHSPFAGTANSMRALLDGWAFTAEGPVTHVSLVNQLGQLLKIQAFTIERPDLEALYEDRVGEPLAAPAGFRVETPVLDLEKITVQFWRHHQLVHEIPLEALAPGDWGTLEETRSGLSLTYGIGERVLPSRAELAQSPRQLLRAHLVAFHYLYLFLATGVLFIISLFRKPTAAELVVPALLLAFLALFLLGRAGFYGLVEAAVVPGVERYMDCAAPIASVFVLLTGTLLGQVTGHWRLRLGNRSGEETIQVPES